MDYEMIERVAKALFEHASVGHILNLAQYSDLKERNKELWKASAIIAIKAMREPTEKMKTLVTDDIVITDKCYYCGGHIQGWRAMIDAVIGE